MIMRYIFAYIILAYNTMILREPGSAGANTVSGPGTNLRH